MFDLELLPDLQQMLDEFVVLCGKFSLTKANDFFTKKVILIGYYSIVKVIPTLLIREVTAWMILVSKICEEVDGKQRESSQSIFDIFVF